MDEVIEEAGDGPDWLIENLLARGAVTDFAGLAKKGGKTTFWCHAIKACTTGEDHCGFSTKPAKFLYLTEQGNNFAEALRGSGLADHPDNIRIVQLKDVRDLKWNHLIKAAGRDTHRLGCDALIIDTFAVLADLRAGEENDSAVITEKMRPLQLIAQTYNLAVILIRHSGKDGTARGSSAFEGIANICATIARPEGRHANTVRRLDAVGHYGEWQLNVDLQNGRYLSLGSDNKVEFNRAVRFVQAVLPTTPGMKKADLMDKRQGEDEEISARTIDRALAWLVEQRDVGEKQLMDERGKPKVYWLAYKPDNGATNGSNVYSRQTTSISNVFGENKYAKRHVEGKRNSQQRATRAAREDKDGSVVELRPDNTPSSPAQPPSGGPAERRAVRWSNDRMTWLERCCANLPGG